MGYDSAGIDDGDNPKGGTIHPSFVDPFEQCQPPKGKVYQWVTISVMGKPVRTWQRHLDAGWNWVRAERHPKFKSDTKDWISYQGQALMVISRENWKKLASIPIDAAKSFDAQYRDVMAGEEIKHQSYSVTDFPNYAYVASSHAESTYVPVPSDAPPVIVTQLIHLSVNARWQDAAAVCGLTVNEYMRRRLMLFSRHALPARSAIIPMRNASFKDEMPLLELVETDNFERPQL